MKKIILLFLLATLAAPIPAAADAELDALLFRLSDETPFARFRIVEEIGDLGTPEAVDALISMFTDDELRWMAVRQLSMFRQAAVPQLLEALESSNEDTVRFAIYTLGDVKATMAFDAILPFLDHESADVRQNTVFALGMMKAEGATDHLIRALEDEDPVVRGYAATALGEIGDPRAKEALLKALKEEDASVVNMATTLMDLGSDQVVDVLIEKLRDPNPNNRLYAVYALGRISDPKQIKPLIEILGHEDIGWLAAKALVNIGDDAVAPLLEALFSEERERRLYATYALGEIGAPQSGRGILRMFRDEDELVRNTAAEALVKLGDPKIVPAITRELASDEPLVRRKALEVLGKLGDESLTDTISSYLSDPEADVVKSAVIALGDIGSERACPALLPLLESRREDIQDALRSSFVKIGKAAVPCLVETLEQKGASQEARAIIILGKVRAEDAVGDLIPYLSHPEPTFRRLATVALTEIGDPRTEEYFVSLLDDPDPALRMYASVGLMNVGGRIAIKLLLSALSNPETHWLAVKILDQIGDRDVDLLIEALKDEKTRWYARQKLIELDGAVLPALEDGLKSEDPLTRESISMVLGEVRDSRAVKPLIEALKDEEHFVMTSAASLIQIGDPTSVEPLIELLTSQNEQVRLYAAYALGGLNDERAVEPLIALLGDPNSTIRGVAAHALGELGSSRAAEPLMDLLEDQSAEVRLTAVHALAKTREQRALDRLEELIAYDASPQVRKAAKESYEAIRRAGR